MKLSKLKINPNNPQKFDDLSKLENSIKEFPKMMELRPIVYDPSNMQVLGGNKRLVCLQNLGFDEIPDNWIVSADILTETEKRRFILADNIGFGEWDWDILESEFSDFKEIGLDFNIDLMPKEIKKMELRPFLKNHILISYSLEKATDIMMLLEEFYNIPGIEIEQSSN